MQKMCHFLYYWQFREYTIIHQWVTCYDIAQNGDNIHNVYWQNAQPRSQTDIFCH